MPDLVTINNTTLEQLTYRGQLVVTFDMIAKVHGIPVGNVHRSFQRHQSRFEEGKHVYRLDYLEASQIVLGVQSNPNGARLFTEKGYLLLVKPMKDERSWQVQERMIDEYFIMRDTLRELPLIQPMLSHDRLTLLKESFAFLQELGMADDRDRLMFADIIRTTTRLEFLPQEAGPDGVAPSRVPEGFFVAEQVAALGYVLTRKQADTLLVTLAKQIAAEYRSRYREEPSKAGRYVDGAVRPVNWYKSEEASWADVLIQRFFADHPDIQRKTAAVRQAIGGQSHA